MGTNVTNEGGISRRSFLGGVAGVGALAAMGLAGCSPKAAGTTGAESASSSASAATGVADNNAVAVDDGSAAITVDWLGAPPEIGDITETKDTDLLIVGAGNGGMIAGAYASDQKMDFILCEKGTEVGATRHWFNAVDTKPFTDQGYHTDRARLHGEWARYSSGTCDHNLINMWMNESNDMFEYVDKYMSEAGAVVIADEFEMPGGMGATPFYTPCGEHHYGNAEGGRDGVPVRNELFEKVMNDNGYEISYKHELVKLVTEDSGKVTGAIFKTDNGYTQINAKKGVLLTTGDMAADREMMAHYNVSLSKIVRYNINTNDTGDGQKMGIWIGADMDEFACGDLWPFAAVMMDGTLPTTFDGTHFYAGVANLPVLMVDGAGRRLMAENLPFQSPSIPKLTCTPDGCAWSIWDSAWKEKFPEGGYMVEDYTASNTQEEVDKNVENGITFKFDTIEELCEHCGFDKDIFMATFERYNELCEAGEDLDFYKDPLWMNAIDTPPFYASKHCSSMTSTRGGLKNDERCRVLDKEGRPIPGLYAAGNTAGSFYGNVYPPNVMGSGIGHGQCFAWLAVKDILGLDYIHANI